MVESRVAKVICCFQIVLAPVVDEPQCDVAAELVDGGHQGRPPHCTGPFLQHRRVCLHALPHCRHSPPRTSSKMGWSCWFMVQSKLVQEAEMGQVCGCDRDSA